MICLHIFYFILILLIVPNDLLYFSFLNCYPIMFYVSFSLRFGLNCFHPTPFLKNGRIVMYVTNLGFFYKVRYCSNIIDFYVSEANCHSPLPG